MSLASIPIIPAEYLEREQKRARSSLPGIWDLLDVVKDPEIPAISIWDLGILADVERDGDTIVVSITPTYSGCPAMDAINEDVRTALQQKGYSNVRVKTCLSPAWTTDWMSPEGRKALQEYGIAPPQRSCSNYETPEHGIQCPHCGSSKTTRISEFGSTACKALFRCDDCFEPFDFFKNI